MRHYKISDDTRWAGLSHLLALFCLVWSWSAEATAPRIAPQLFGEARKADIVGYQLASPEAAARVEAELVLAVVTEAFRAAGKTPTVDMLPSKQLARYALLNQEAAALIGSPQDLTEKERGQHRMVTFYFRGDEPVVLIFSKKHALGNELYQAFNEGMQKMLRSGKYQEILELHLGRGQAPADLTTRLKRQNRGWK